MTYDQETLRLAIKYFNAHALGKTLSDKLENAFALRAEGEDAALYLAKTCSMHELIKVKEVARSLGEDALVIMESNAKHGEVIQLTGTKN